MCNAVCNFPTFNGGVRLMPISRLSATSCVGLELRPLPSTGVTRLRRYYGPLRYPRRPSLSLAGVWLRGSAPRRSGFPCCVDLRVPTCRRHYPGGPLGSDRSWDGLFQPFPFIPSGGGLPLPCAGSASTLDVSRPARRSLALRPVGSLHRQSDPSVSKAPTVLLLREIPVIDGDLIKVIAAPCDTHSVGMACCGGTVPFPF